MRPARAADGRPAGSSPAAHDGADAGTPAGRAGQDGQQWRSSPADRRRGAAQWRAMTENAIPNVLAGRYASAELVRLWAPEQKVVLERQLWLAVLRAQRDLGIDVPDGVIEAYEAVIDRVDLESIAARERVTRHDVKAR